MSISILSQTSDAVKQPTFSLYKLKPEMAFFLRQQEIEQQLQQYEKIQT